MKWKYIKDTDKKYMVSEFGDVKSLVRKKPLIMKGGKHKDGYRMVLIKVNGKPKYCTVHRLVALAFLKREKDKNIVNHKDFNVLNNHYSNLEWTTIAGNTEHARKAGKIICNRGEKHGMNFLKEEQVREIRELAMSGKITQQKIADRFNITQAQVCSIKTGRTWGWLE